MQNTESLTGQIQALIQHWRDVASLLSIRVKSNQLRQCADELEALLAAQPEPTIQRSVVTDLPGNPVAAPCAIEGCRYAELETAIQKLSAPTPSAPAVTLKLNKDEEAIYRDNCIAMGALGIVDTDKAKRDAIIAFYLESQ